MATWSNIDHAHMTRVFAPSEVIDLTVKPLGSRHVLVGYHPETDQAVIMSSHETYDLAYAAYRVMIREKATGRHHHKEAREQKAKGAVAGG